MSEFLLDEYIVDWPHITPVIHWDFNLSYLEDKLLTVSRIYGQSDVTQS